MKIIVWAEYFLPVIGGVEVFLSQLIPALGKRNIEFHIVTSRNRDRFSEYEIWNGFPIYRHKFHEAFLGNIVTFSDIRKKIGTLYQEVRPDLIHLHTTGPSLFFEMQTHRDFKIPRFLTTHSFFDYPPHEDGYLRKYLPRVNYVNGVSKCMLHMMLNLFHGTPPPHQLIYNGVETPSDTPKTPEKIEENILFLGRLSREKGIDLAIRAFKHFCKSRPLAKLWIAGEGPEKDALQSLVRDLEMNDRVLFIGCIDPKKVYQTICSSRFLIMPSRFDEGLPLTALQAAHMGKPVIGARRGGLPEIVRDGETGLLFEPEDWQGLAAAMERLWDAPDLCRTLGEKARELAKTQFDFTAMVDAYERIYRQLAPGK